MNIYWSPEYSIGLISAEPRCQIDYHRFAFINLMAGGIGNTKISGGQISSLINKFWSDSYCFNWFIFVFDNNSFFSDWRKVTRSCQPVACGRYYFIGSLPLVHPDFLAQDIEIGRDEPISLEFLVWPFYFYFLIRFLIKNVNTHLRSFSFEYLISFTSLWWVYFIQGIKKISKRNQIGVLSTYSCISMIFISRFHSFNRPLSENAVFLFWTFTSLTWFWRVLLSLGEVLATVWNICRWERNDHRRPIQICALLFWRQEQHSSLHSRWLGKADSTDHSRLYHSSQLPHCEAGPAE
jgi:hypothetical protein